MTASSAAAQWRFGTYRACPPEETYERLQQVFEPVGLTRVADVTWLDTPGIPVFQAIRPNARSLSVSQGKGLTSMLARVSAAMESIELWHAERVTDPVERAPIAALRADLHYDPYDLALATPTFLHDELELDWMQGRILRSGEPALVPRALVHLGQARAPSRPLALFRVSSNGLAGGNTYAEAALHGLCEVLERDCIVRDRPLPLADRREIDLSTVDDPGCRWVLEAFEAAEIECVAYDITGPVGVPAFAAATFSTDLPLVVRGWGCHPAKQVALSRALTEAAQGRLVHIAGSRDNLPVAYDWQDALLAPPPPPRNRPELTVSFSDLTEPPIGDIEEMLEAVAAAVEERTGQPVIALDHTREDLRVPVVHVVAPGLEPHRRIRA